ncbi:MAG: helix-turn-helix domain-containing protein, partial [Nitrospinota bacterium]|nr:helix-turn-helix domain-containing protein [Nitrospinota bacterium]
DHVAAESSALRDAFKPNFFVGIKGGGSVSVDPSVITEEGIDLKKMVEDFEKELIVEALDRTDWVKNKAAGLLGLNRTTLVEKIKKLQLTREVV